MKFSKILILAMSILCAYSCTSTWFFEQTYEEYRAIIDNDTLPDGTRYIYVVDTIPFDTVNYCVVRSKIGNQYYYLSKEYLKNHKVITNEDALKERQLLYRSDFSWRADSKIGKTFNDEEFPSGNKSILIPYNDDWSIVHYKNEPKFLRVYMIRGDVFNTIWGTAVIDMPFRTFPFPDMNAYYKVVTPIWDIPDEKK